MEFKTDEASLRADSNKVGEISLYDELVAFSNLSPEEQRREPAPSLMNDSEPARQPTGEFIYADLTHSNEASSEQDEGRESRSSEPIMQRPFELIDRAESRPAEEGSSDPVEDFPFELPDEPAPEVKLGPSFERPQADESNQSGDADLDLAYLLRVTGPLVAAGMRMNAGAPLLVCRDCRSQSSSEDMFCVACGGLLDEAEASEEVVKVAAAGLTCNDCDYLIEEEEIFCPSCGAAI